ncbi:MAG: carboxypeptidase regulatory-like domain-containing protein [Gemmatimonadaceae bacterium]|nr:carboxypeptidase regulatory-like domain-containing protein [Gemmatimonadaceae bacterium]
MRHWYPLVTAALLCVPSVDRPIGAQAAPSLPARIALVDAVSGEALREALVRFDPIDGGTGAEQLLVDGVTRALTVPGAGAYRVRVRRPDAAWWSSEIVTLPAPSPSTLTVRVESRPLRVAVPAPATACVVSPAEGSAPATALESVRASLALVQRAQDEGLAPLFVRRTVRVSAGAPARDREWRTEWGRARAIGAGNDSVDVVAGSGLLRSDAAAAPCVALVPGSGARAGQVGLSFAPPSGRTAPDVSGTAWLDATSLALRAIEYRSVNAPPGRASIATAEVTFAVRDNGVRTVSGWQLRRTRDTETIEEIAEVRPATAGDALALGARVGTIEGLLYDSLRMAPLADAAVHVATLGRTVYADGAGWFTLDLLPAGTHALEVAHPRLDSLALPIALRVRADSGASAQLVVSTPSLATLRQRTCPDTLGRGRDVLLLGRVRDAATGMPVAKAGALIKWFETGKNVRGFFDVKPKEAAAFTEADGSFRGCVPANVAFSIAGVAETISGELEYPGTSESVTSLDLWVDRDSTATRRGALGGTVRDSSGRGIAGATVALDGVAEVARTDSSGAFALRGLPVGSRMLDVRRLGYAAIRIPVVVRPGGADPLRIVAQPARTLARRTVTGQYALSAKLQGFEERRRLGFGTFFDANQLEFFKNTTVTSVVRRVLPP